MLPDVNDLVATGMPLPESIIKKLGDYDVVDVKMKIFQDFMSVGLKLDLWFFIIANINYIINNLN